MNKIKEFDDIVRLFCEMKMECVGEILPCDRPPYLQWIDVKNEVIYRISMKSVAKFLKSDILTVNEIQSFKEYFGNSRTSENTLNLLKIPTFDKLIRLKSFW